MISDIKFYIDENSARQVSFTRKVYNGMEVILTTVETLSELLKGEFININ